jgi:hypothetical protein
MELSQDELNRVYQSLLNQRERAKRNYQKNRETILIKRKEHREKKLEGQVRNPVGRPRKVEVGEGGRGIVKKVCEVEAKTD